MPEAIIVIALVYGFALLLEAINNMGITSALVLFGIFSVIVIVDLITEKIKNSKNKLHSSPSITKNFY